jgi:uncharacterized linocin/CFP29 family protein
MKMDILKQNLAPITEKAWGEINEQAKFIFKTFLTARKVVDVEGPKGIDLAAVPTGRLEVPKSQSNEVQYGIHKVMPIVETRQSFKLNIWELDNVNRGVKDVDLEPLEDAAKKMAEFEEKAVYYGFEKAGISGLKSSSGNKCLSCPKNAEELVTGIPEGIRMMKEAAIEGPYSLVVNAKRWEEINQYKQGYPLNKHINDIIGGEIILSPSIDSMFLVSQRGGDLVLTLGADLSIGYELHDSKDVQLYFMESFTFQILEPKAFVVYE